MNDYWNSVDQVTLPVKLVNGRWELLYGGSTGVCEGSYGELRVAASSIADEAVRQRLMQTVTVKVFDEGAELLVALTDRDHQWRGNEPCAIDPADLPAGCTRLARIRIGPKSPRTEHIDAERGGLWIRQRGVDRTDLVCSGVWMPEGFGSDAANSLNHACTLLSERYEKHRISHTLNVYKHVFYLEQVDQQSRWHPLEALRKGVIADMERRSGVHAGDDRLQPGSHANLGTVAPEFRTTSMKGPLMAQKSPESGRNLVDATSILHQYGLIASG